MQLRPQGGKQPVEIRPGQRGVHRVSILSGRDRPRQRRSAPPKGFGARRKNRRNPFGVTLRPFLCRPAPGRPYQAKEKPMQLYTFVGSSNGRKAEAVIN